MTGPAKFLIDRRPPIWVRMLKTEKANLIGLWRMNDLSGVVCTDSSGLANHGTYTNITLGQTGFDGQPCVYIDNTADAITALAAADDFNGSEGTFVGWFKPTGYTNERYFRARYDANNQVNIIGNSTINRIDYYYYAGGVTKFAQYVSPTNLIGNWYSVGITWSKTADEVKCYHKGVQVGATLTGLGNWAGVPVMFELAAGSGTALLGYVQYLAVWTKALTAAQMKYVGSL